MSLWSDRGVPGYVFFKPTPQLGKIMGGCFRSEENLPLALPWFTWKQLLGDPVRKRWRVCGLFGYFADSAMIPPQVTWDKDFVSVDYAAVCDMALVLSADEVEARQG